MLHKINILWIFCLFFYMPVCFSVCCLPLLLVSFAGKAYCWHAIKIPETSIC